MPSKDIAVALRAIDPVKYAAIIKRAENNGYHDHKFAKIPDHPEYGKCDDPKTQLVLDLQPYPELNSIRHDVIDGKYDDKPDEEDVEEMRGWLLDDDATDDFFIGMGFKPPTSEERELRRKQNQAN